MPCHAARRHIVRSMARNVTSPTQDQNSGQVIWIATGAQRRLMVRLKPAGVAALGAAVAVALEGGAAHCGPSPGIQRSMVMV